MDQNLQSIKRTLLILSGKGGVGKSTVAVYLAAGLARRGLKVGLMDVDLHGPSIPTMLGLQGKAATSDGTMIEPALYDVGGGSEAEPLRVISIAFFLKSRNDAVIWRGPMKTTAIKQFLGQVSWGALDYLIVDSPPGTGDEPLSVAQSIPGAQAVVVTTPQDISLSDVRRSIGFCNALKMKIVGVIENMSGLVCPHCGGRIDLFKMGGGRKMAGEMGVPFLGALPIDPSVVTAGDDGDLLEDGPTLEAFDEIIDKIAEPDSV